MGTDVFSQLFSSKSGEQVKVGGFDENLDLSYGIFSDGLYVSEIVPHIGRFITLDKPLTLPSLEKGKQIFYFHNSFIRIPIGILNATVEFYLRISQEISSEVMTMIVYDTILQQYKIVVPVQTVSGATVKYEHVAFAPHEKFIVSCHSHVNMQAFFSNVDDADEKRAMFYGVIGRISDPTPAMKFRAKKNNTSFELTIDMLFDSESSFEYKIPDTERLKITQATSIYGGVNLGYPLSRINNSNTVPAHRPYDYYGRGGRNYYGNYTSPDNTPDEFDYIPSNGKLPGNKKKSFDVFEELLFLDPAVNSSLKSFLRVYLNYLDQSLMQELTTEEIAEHNDELSEKMLSFLESLDVDDGFHNAFYEKYFEDELIDSSPWIEEEDEEGRLLDLEKISNQGLGIHI